MKVLLVKPVSGMHVVLPPIGLGYLSSYCKKENPGTEIKIIDCNRERYTREKFAGFLRAYLPDIIGFTAFSMELDSALAFAKVAKDTLNNVTVVVGGAHASADAEGVLACPSVDYVFRGEAEIGFAEFIKFFPSPQMLGAPGLAYRAAGSIVMNAHAYVDDLDTLPFPDYRGMCLEKYPKMYFMKYFPAAPVMSSRGCPFQCAFCAGHKISGRKWRGRSAGSIMAEINYLCDNYNVMEIDFWDDNFTMDRGRVVQLCSELKRSGRRLAWWCPNGVHLNTLDQNLIKEMKESGCYAMAFGVESGSEAIRKDMGKILSPGKLREMVTFAHSAGLRTQGFFIIGYPSEREEDILETIRLSKTLPFLRASFCLFQPIPGSAAYEKLFGPGGNGRTAGMELACDYSRSSVPTAYIRDTARIKKLQKKAILEFYMRPRVLLRLIRENLTVTQFWELVNILKHYILRK